jgi:SAM-dependent MidA family methyltransferase
MWEHLGRPEEFMLVEAGAGVGRLASHILDFSALALSDFYRALNYVAVERSALRREQTAKQLKLHAEAGRVVISAEIPLHIPAGCVFTNELVDALPVHRVVLQGGTLREVFVGCMDGQFADHMTELSTCAINEYFGTQGIALLEGQHAEAGLEACDWITEVGRRVERGYVLTIDYGHPAGDLFDEHHMRGTLLAYHDHRATENYYTSPGEQDLTAHVNFTALETWGKRSGLETSGFTSQTMFLLALGQRNEFADLHDDGQSEADRVRARLQLKTLIHPEGMGERFQVLIQQKGTTRSQLAGLAGISHPK